MALEHDEALQAFSAAYEKYADAIYRHCYIRVRDQQYAEDLMEEAFIRAWNYLAKGKEIENFQAFIYRTANNLIIDGVRRAKGREVVSLDSLAEKGMEPGHDPTVAWGENMTEAHALQLVHKVKEPYRSVLIMRYVDGLTPAEIAKVTGEKSNVIWTRLYRGLKYLKDLFEDA